MTFVRRVDRHIEGVGEFRWIEKNFSKKFFQQRIFSSWKNGFSDDEFSFFG